MSDKPVAMIAATLVAVALAVVCCALGPAASLALASGMITGTATNLIGEISLPDTMVSAIGNM